MTAETTYRFAKRECFGKAAKAAFDCRNCVIKCKFKSFSVMEGGKCNGCGELTPSCCVKVLSFPGIMAYGVIEMLRLFQH